MYDFWEIKIKMILLKLLRASSIEWKEKKVEYKKYESYKFDC